MSSSTVPTRRKGGVIAVFFAVLPGILLSGGVYAFLNWDLHQHMPQGFAGAAGLTIGIVPGLIALFARPGHAGHWTALVVVTALTMTFAALATGISNLLFRDSILGMNSPHLAGALHGAPGFFVSPFVFWVLHRLAGDASPWTLDEG